MATLKIVVVLGLLASAVAVGLAFAWGALTGTPVSSDELLRHALLSFVITGGVVGALRWRSARP
jgi:hypothetical protein